MVIKDSSSSLVSDVKWVGNYLQNLHVPRLENLNVFYYKKCIIGPLTIAVGDYVLVPNADSREPDTVEGCDIAKILHLFELIDTDVKRPYRAIVQWYSRPNAIPHEEFDSDEICVDFNLEIIEEHRPYDTIIKLDIIYAKCSVIIGSEEDTATNLLKQFAHKRRSNSCPMFVCRYKFIKEKQHYRLVPLHSMQDYSAGNKETLPSRCQNSAIEQAETKQVGSARKPKSDSNFTQQKRRRASVATASAVEFVDLTCFNNENTVSPIKIIGGRSVVRLSEKKKDKQKEEINANYLIASPLTEKNNKILTPTSRAAAARRNLNLTLENQHGDTTADSDCLNYSIVKSTPNADDPSNEMKIKLRLSERRRSVRLVSVEEDPLAITETKENHLRKRLAIDVSTPKLSNIYETPTKKNKSSAVEATAEQTPSNRRKSILKSASSRLDGTPKRNIQLSSVVQQRVFQEDDIISTPKRTRKTILPAATQDDADDPEYTPKKTPKRGRRSSTKTQKSPTQEPTPLTPSQKLKLIRSGAITPSLEERLAVSKSRRKSELQQAREQLHVSVVPKSLPCREKEFENIYTFLEGKIQDQCGGCMYVSGVPGTGKTATVTGVIRELQRRVAKDDLPEFDFLEINGMRLTEPRQAYVQIYRQLTGKTVSWEHAHSLLEKRFTTPAPRRITTVLLVDELDILCNRRQDVVYNLLDWPTKSAARLVVVTIANTMDLPERLLMGKVTSRLGLTRLTFQPYTHKQLQEIVSARLSGTDAFKSEAVQLVARKVAAVSGDARRALDICRRATEIADSSTIPNDVAQKCVTMLHVQQALAEMIASAKVQAIKNCSRIEQLFLQAIVAEVTRTGVEETTFMGVYTQVESIAAFMGATVPSSSRALRICSKLGAERLIICEHSRNDVFQKILLNVSSDDIHYALRVNPNNT